MASSLRRPAVLAGTSPSPPRLKAPTTAVLCLSHRSHHNHLLRESATNRFISGLNVGWFLREPWIVPQPHSPEGKEGKGAQGGGAQGQRGKRARQRIKKRSVIVVKGPMARTDPGRGVAPLWIALAHSPFVPCALSVYPECPGGMETGMQTGHGLTPHNHATPGWLASWLADASLILSSLWIPFILIACHSRNILSSSSLHLFFFISSLSLLFLC